MNEEGMHEAYSDIFVKNNIIFYYNFYSLFI